MTGDPRTPGPRGLAVLKLVLRRTRSPFLAMLHLAEEYGRAVHVRVGRVDHFLLSTVAAARHVLVENSQNYGKGPGYRYWARVLGDGLITSDGERWRAHRRLVQPSLHHARMGGFVDIMGDVAEAEAERLARTAGEVVDVYDRTMRIALRVAARAFLGSDLGEREDDVCTAFVEVFDHIQGLVASPLRVLPMIPGLRVLDPVVDAVRKRTSPAEHRFESALGTLESIIGEVIARRRRELSGGVPGDDLVSRLLAAEGDGPGTGLTDRDVRDEVMTMFVAGHETAATALAWCLRMLADHPEHAERVADEAGRIGERRIGLEDLERLPHARRVFEESLRLYPPVWQVTRRARRDDRVAGVPVPRGSTVIVSPYLLHRDPELWEDPERFEPARFEGDWPRDAFLPFGAGQRMCPGGAFATAEAQIVLAAFARRIVLRPVTPTPPDVDPRLTLRPRGGMPLRVDRGPSLSRREH